MKDLNKLYHEVLADFDALSIPYGKVVSVTANGRAQSRWGQCRKKPDGYYIDINKSLLDDALEDHGAKDTIAHELCHTIDGCLNHGAKWKRYAKMLGVFGYVIKRTDTAADKGISMQLVKENPNNHYKYAVICETCGQASYYCKRCKVIQALQKGSKNYKCGRCNCDRLKLEYL